MFRERLAEAKKLIERAWKPDSGDPRLCNAMLTVAVGRSYKRPEMERWFERAMKLDTNNYTACQAKLHYLKPQWLGFAEEMLSFGRQCFSNPWGGQVPLTLVALQPEPQRKDYGKDNEVWPDIKSSFESCFALNGETEDCRHNYAWCAFQAGRGKTFRQQPPLFQGTNYAQFGGKAEFDRMVATDRARARNP